MNVKYKDDPVVLLEMTEEESMHLMNVLGRFKIGENTLSIDREEHKVTDNIYCILDDLTD